MSPFVSGYCSRFVLRLALTGVSAGALAGCASSERLADALGNPYQSTATAADPAPASPPSAARAPVMAVQSRPLSPPAAQAGTPAQAAPKPVAAAAPSSATAFGGWTAQGGTPITVAQGDSAEGLARRYGIPVEALVRTNGFASASEVQPGARLVVPVYSAALAAASPTKPTMQRGAELPRAGVVVPKPPVAPSKTATSALAAPKPVAAVPVPAAPKPVAAAPASVPPTRHAALQPPPAGKAAEGPIVIKPQGISVPGVRKHEPVKKLATATSPEPIPAQPSKLAPAPKAEMLKTAKAEPAVMEPRKVEPEPAPLAQQETAKTKIASEAANPEFRWPARGRIIQGFKPGGNDGINIAVPEGTSVKAAENGVVAYAGELKGYGNLVMIRHPNGFVSAYANNGDIEVKRGDNVKRGQTIAKSGQSGDVASPQLHFELRKGATPVDPTQFLAGL
jgi:murein DD-endopeptidase MepM/ murein hydrolase activator NlpD